MRDVNKKFDDSLGYGLRNSLWDYFRHSLIHSLGHRLNNSLRDSLRDSLWHSLSDSLGDSLRDSLNQTAQNEQNVKEMNDA